MKICRLCFTTPAKSYPASGLMMCIACFDEISELKCLSDEPSELIIEENENPLKIKSSSVFWYSGIVRRLIIAAKVKSDATALKRLLVIWESEITSLPMINSLQVVMPCPSSLWSRMHGRIDISWFLAERIARIYGIPLVLPHRSTYWNWKKRSQTARPVDNLLTTGGITFAPPNKAHQQYSEKYRSCLLVDDVVTTGTTLKRCIVASKLTNSFRFSTLTLSKARQIGPQY